MISYLIIEAGSGFGKTRLAVELMKRIFSADFPEAGEHQSTTTIWSFVEAAEDKKEYRPPESQEFKDRETVMGTEYLLAVAADNCVSWKPNTLKEFLEAVPRRKDQWVVWFVTIDEFSAGISYATAVVRAAANWNFGTDESGGGDAATVKAIIYPILVGLSSLDLPDSIRKVKVSKWTPRTVTLPLQSKSSDDWMNSLVAVLQASSNVKSRTASSGSGGVSDAIHPEFKRLVTLLNAWPIGYDFLLAAIKHVRPAPLSQLRMEQLPTVLAELSARISNRYNATELVALFGGSRALQICLILAGSGVGVSSSLKINGKTLARAQANGLFTLKPTDVDDVGGDPLDPQKKVTVEMSPILFRALNDSLPPANRIVQNPSILDAFSRSWAGTSSSFLACVEPCADRSFFTVGSLPVALEVIAIESMRIRIMGFRAVKQLEDEAKSAAASAAAASHDAVPISFGSDAIVKVGDLRSGASISPKASDIHITLTASQQLCVEQAPGLLACLKSEKTDKTEKTEKTEDSTTPVPAAAATDNKASEPKPRGRPSSATIKVAANLALVDKSSEPLSTASNPYFAVKDLVTIDCACETIERRVLDGVLFRCVENQNIFDAMATFPSPTDPKKIGA